MAIDKTSWHKLGLTPREFSKKLGVTRSMAEFIVDSYRVPVGPQDACKLKSSQKENPCTTECTSQSETTTNVVAHCSTKRSQDEQSDSNDISAPCASNKTCEASTSTRTCDIAPDTRCENPDLASTLCRKRSREQQLSDCDTSCSDPQSDTDSDDGYYQICTTTRRSGKRCKTTPRRKARCPKRKKKPMKRREKTVKDKKRKKEMCREKQKMIPINVSLEIPLNVYLNDDDSVWIDPEAKACIKCIDQCPDVQSPPGDQQCCSDQVREKCREPGPGHSPHHGEEGDDDEEEACSEDSARTKKSSCSEERVCHNQGAVAQSSSQLWSWQGFKECLDYIESRLAGMVNKW